MTVINFHTNNRIICNGSSMPVFGCGFSPMFTPGCFGFGFGYGGFCGDSFGKGIGMGLGYTAGMCLIPALPVIFMGIGKGCSWLWNKIFHKDSNTEKVENQK